MVVAAYLVVEIVSVGLPLWEIPEFIATMIASGTVGHVIENIQMSTFLVIAMNLQMSTFLVIAMIEKVWCIHS